MKVCITASNIDSGEIIYCSFEEADSIKRDKVKSDLMGGIVGYYFENQSDDYFYTVLNEDDIESCLCSRDVYDKYLVYPINKNTLISANGIRVAFDYAIINKSIN